jgi:DNA-directed RNA polymerase subunit H (RpoH/RPB5)
VDTSKLFIIQGKISWNIYNIRNFNVNDYNNFSVNEIDTMYRNKQLDMLIERPENTQLKITPKKAYVRYHLAKTLRPANINEYIDELFTVESILTENDDLILIVRDEPNETIIKTLKQIWESEKKFIIIWHINHLQFNVLNHVLVPRHIVLNPEEDAAFRKQYNILNDSEMPNISRFDPPAMAIGLRPGQICKAIRSSKTAIHSEYYRFCSS